MTYDCAWKIRQSTNRQSEFSSHSHESKKIDTKKSQCKQTFLRSRPNLSCISKWYIYMDKFSSDCINILLYTCVYCKHIFIFIIAMYGNTSGTIFFTTFSSICSTWCRNVQSDNEHLSTLFCGTRIFVYWHVHYSDTC